MQADVLEMGKGFIRLEKVGNTELAEDVIKYDGADTFLLDCYTLDMDGDGYAYKTAEQLGKVEIVRTDAVAIIGESGGGVRCYVHDITAYKDADGNIWMDEQLHDDVFC